MSPKTKTTEEKPVTQTVKLEQELFVRLKTYSAKTRRTNQDILRTALIEYLNKMKS
jgi:predicted DNA-binding protein